MHIKHITDTLHLRQRTGWSQIAGVGIVVVEPRQGRFHVGVAVNRRRWRHLTGDISEYIDLLDGYIEGKSTAAEFETTLLTAMKSEHRTLGEPVFPILEGLFEDADAYVAHPELRTSARPRRRATPGLRFSG